MKVEVSGTRNGVRWPGIGEEIVVPDAEGADLCSQGFAEAVAEPERPRAEKRPAARKPEKRG